MFFVVPVVIAAAFSVGILAFFQDEAHFSLGGWVDFLNGSAYLAEVCGADDELLQEIASLVSQASAESGFLDPRAIDVDDARGVEAERPFCGASLS